MDTSTNDSVQQEYFLPTALRVMPSNYTVEQTVERLKNGLTAKGMTIFSVIDYQQIAKDMGVEMQPSAVIFLAIPKLHQY